MNLNTIQFKDGKGLDKTIKDFNAKAYLIVNVASKCGLTPQYEALQNLYSEYKDQGLEILAFPANEFLGQEPGTNEEIQQFCNLEYNVTFPVNEKIIVKGEGQHPLYKALTESKKDAVRNDKPDFEQLLTNKGLISGMPHDIHWNFEKFLLDQDGEIIERFFPDIAPTDEKIISKLKELL
ncbi:glutathione peroxidase [Bacteriovorax sp. BAL6_X]|uniref:glutathione peroxidase n=1 Tax=Bacteriovorax sp. BAL6_X TaxID=1201290 RepID=UPI0003868313|nr:glutathione peroxidase [Bacteriovorax sp. BAL6_X]EPZ52090.1 glutathione peroxidase [Bacteriovorax sp. BAL6_X]